MMIMLTASVIRLRKMPEESIRQVFIPVMRLLMIMIILRLSMIIVMITIGLIMMIIIVIVN